jgi:hypothetical protein
MLECLPQEACLGGFGSPCRVGYVGRKCGFCAPHFYRENTFCKACSTQAPVFLALGVVALCGVAALIARYGRHFSGMTASRLLSDFLLVSMSVIGFDVHWSQRVKDFVESVKIVADYLATYTNFVKPECEVALPYKVRWAFAVIVPVAVILLLLIVGWLHRMLVGFLLSKDFRTFLSRREVNALMEVCWPGHCGNLCTHRVYFKIPGKTMECFACQECHLSALAQAPLDSNVWSCEPFHGARMPCCLSPNCSLKSHWRVQYRQWVAFVCSAHLDTVRSGGRTWTELGRGSGASPAVSSAAPLAPSDTPVAAPVAATVPPLRAFSLLLWHQQLALILQGLRHAYFPGRYRAALLAAGVLASWIAGGIVAGVWGGRVGYLDGINTGFQELVVFLVTSALVQTALYALWRTVSFIRGTEQLQGPRDGLVRLWGACFELVGVVVLATFAPLFLGCALIVAPLALIEIHWQLVRKLLYCIAVLVGGVLGAVTTPLIGVVGTGVRLLDPGLLVSIAMAGALGSDVKEWLLLARNSQFGSDSGWWATHVTWPVQLLRRVRCSRSGVLLAPVVVIVGVVSLALAAVVAAVRAMVIAPALLKPSSRRPAMYVL